MNNLFSPPPLQTFSLETINLIRHARSIANENGTIAGQLDVPISPTGMADMITYLSTSKIHDLHKFPCFVSPLSRAVETAKTLGFNNPQVIREFSETDSGSISHWTFNQVAEKYPQFSHNKMDLDFRYPDGETTREMIERVVNTFEALCASSNYREFTVVAHNGPLNALLSALMGITLESFPSFCLQHNRVTRLIKKHKQSKYWSLQDLNI